MQVFGENETQHEDTVDAPPAPFKLLLTVDEAARALGVRRTFFYTKLLQTGEVFSLKLEGRRLIPAQALLNYVERLMTLQKAS